MFRSNDDILAEWRKVETRVKEVAEACQANPAEAQLTYDVTPERQRPSDLTKTFGGERVAARENEWAVWLRAAAKSLVPEHFEWEVVETVGGGAHLMLKSYREEPGAFLDSIAP